MRTVNRKPGRTQDPALTDRLLTLALNRIAHAGLERLNLDRLAREAGTSKQAIYRRYASKSDLGRAAVEAALNALAIPAPDRSNAARDVFRLLTAYRQTVFLAPIGRAALHLSLDPAGGAAKHRIDQDLAFRLRQILIATPFERHMDTRIRLFTSSLWQETVDRMTKPAQPGADLEDDLDADLEDVIHLVLGLGPKLA
ncbi:TetR/AcrR family transcriptional regulator [Roseibium aquae]|nr:TetR/AcrR family transcriptional regulator [Roseibium aquae]